MRLGLESRAVIVDRIELSSSPPGGSRAGYLTRYVLTRYVLTRYVAGRKSIG